MLIYLIVGSIREGRTAIKVAHWIMDCISNFSLHDINIELIDLKQWDLPLFSGSHPPAMGIYDQPKQQQWADKIALADAFIFISPEYNHGYSPGLKKCLRLSRQRVARQTCCIYWLWYDQWLSRHQSDPSSKLKFEYGRRECNIRNSRHL